jgi:hypothetical protein
MAIPLRLPHHAIGKLGARHALGETGVVIDAITDGGLAAEGARIDDDRVDALTGGVDGCRQPGGSAPHDHQVVGEPRRFQGEPDAARQHFVSGVHLMRAVAMDNRRNDLCAVLQLLEMFDRTRSFVNVDVLVWNPMRRKELLHALAVRTPGAPYTVIASSKLAIAEC